MEEYFNICIEEAMKAFEIGEVPIGSVIVFNNEIIAKSHNNRDESKDVTGHAEINAMREAAEKLGDWRLNECDLYVTLEPCRMCMEVIKEARIRNVYYLVKKDDYKHSSEKTNFECLNDDSFQQLINDYKSKLSMFFKLNCNR